MTCGAGLNNTSSQRRDRIPLNPDYVLLRLSRMRRCLTGRSETIWSPLVSAWGWQRQEHKHLESTHSLSVSKGVRATYPRGVADLRQGGVLSQRLPGYQERPSQIEMENPGRRVPE